MEPLEESVDDSQNTGDPDISERLAREAAHLAFGWYRNSRWSELDPVQLLTDAYTAAFLADQCADLMLSIRCNWLLTHAQATLGKPDLALTHARLCELRSRETEGPDRELQRAYAYEALGEAHDSMGDASEASRYLRLARETSALVPPQQRAEFLSETDHSDWLD